MLAISVPLLRHPYFMGVFHALFETCQQRGYGVFVYQASRGPARRAFDWPVDGVIVADGADMIQRNELPNHLPVVSIGAYVDTDVDHVRVDILGGATQAVSHLVEIGCKRIVHVRIPVSADAIDDRDRAYVDVLRESALVTETVTITKAEPEQVRIAVREYVRREGKPDGFFCTNDLSALATVRGMADLGYFAPKDYAIVGFDGIDQGEMTVPSITTVSQPVQQMCDHAVEFLLNRIREPNRVLQSAVLETALVVRESTAQR
jgi:DNA-binding LacI/PurR family transcriptional regulator